MNLSSNLLKKAKPKSNEANTQLVNVSTDVLNRKKRDPANYIKAAKKNKWIKHVKKIGKKSNVSFKDALKLCKSKK
jgi:hypothetical protein